MTISELSPTHISSGKSDFASTGASIRNFRLSLNDVDVELSSLGASIVEVLLPNYADEEAEAEAASAGAPRTKRDDVVLSYSSPKEQCNDENRPYFGSIVGRVANRIKGGKFELEQEQRREKNTGNTQYESHTYQLEKNNGPNHLHGGFDGFCHRVWDAEIIGGDTVRFTLVSDDGDQGYPGAVRVCAEYSLLRIQGRAKGAKLCLSMRASLLPGETKATPIGLAQHSYFNLASHSSRVGVLDHILHMPNCSEFTPVDRSLIPTREVQRVEDAVSRNGRGKAMHFGSPKPMNEALIQYGIEVVGLDESTARNNVNRRLLISQEEGVKGANFDGGFDPGTVDVARVPKEGGASGANLGGGEPYGFDHNYVIKRDDEPTSNESKLRLAAVLSHPPTRRCLTVSTTAPGVQLYTANYLDGSSPSPTMCKECTKYYQWQALCLETQTYPNSVFAGGEESIPAEESDFSKGRCFILRPGGGEYVHDVEYEFGEVLA